MEVNWYHIKGAKIRDDGRTTLLALCDQHAAKSLVSDHIVFVDEGHMGLACSFFTCRQSNPISDVLPADTLPLSQRAARTRLAISTSKKNRKGGSK